MSLRGHVPASLERHVPAGLEGRSIQSLRHGPFSPLRHRHEVDPALPPPHLELLERKVSFQFNEMERLARENVRLAESHTAMRQEIAASQKEIDAIQAHLAGARSEVDIQMMGVFEKIKNLETGIRIGESVRVELHQVHVEAQALTAAREELGAEMRQVSEELERCASDNRKLHDMYKELDGLRQEHHKLRSTFEYEKGTNIQQVEQMQGMEKNLMSMGKEVEKLRADIANAEKRIQRATGAAARSVQYQNPPVPVYQQHPAGAYGNQGYGQGVTYPHYSYAVPSTYGQGQGGPPLYQNASYVAPQNHPVPGVIPTDATTLTNHYLTSNVPAYAAPPPPPPPYGAAAMLSYDPSGGSTASAAANPS